METIWMAMCEVLVEPGDLPSGSTKAFANIMTWADSSDTAKDKISSYLESFRWHLVSFEDAYPLDETRTYDDETSDMIERTKGNPDAIILGRFFSYKED
jgi:hypothetical protein